MGPGDKQRIICFAPPEIAEIVDTMALLHALRRHFPKAHLAVGCDLSVASLAQACTAVNEVVVLRRSRIPGLARWKNAARVRKFDWAIAACARFDRRLAELVRLTKAPIRIGFESRPNRSSRWFTDPVALPPEAEAEHRIDTLLRLLKPLGLVRATRWAAEQQQLILPEAARTLMDEALQDRPFIMGDGYALINLGSAGPLKFREAEVITLAGHLLAATPFAIALIAGPADQRIADEIALVMGSPRIGVLNPLAPVELAALIERAVMLVTVEDAAAHLAVAMGTPAVVVWPGSSPFEQTHPRGRKHVFVRLEAGETMAPAERVWQAMQALLTSKKYDIEKQWADLLELPPSTELS